MNTLVDIEPTDVPAAEGLESLEPANDEPLSEAEGSAEHASRYARISVAAYYRAEVRGFAAGGELEDWLAAEADIDGAEPAPNGSGQHAG